MPSRTSIGVLTHIRIEALQLAPKEVSFWYKDKAATAIGPSELTGLLGLELSEKGIDVDLKVRLIPALVTAANSGKAKMHFNVVERAEVSISDDVRAIVRDTNHAVPVALFWPIMVMRLREVLEKRLSEQLRAVVNCPRPVSPSLISAASYIFILRDFDRRIHLSFSCWKCSISPKNSNPSHRQPYTRTIPFTNETLTQCLPVPSLHDPTFAFHDRGKDHKTNCIPSVFRRSS